MSIGKAGRPLPATRGLAMDAVVVAVAVATLLMAALSGLVAAPALAHATSTTTSPADGAVLDEPPAIVSVTFDGPIMDVGAAIVVRSADGTVVSTGPADVGRREISTSVRTDGPAGGYTVAFRVVSEDGHPISSTFGYTVAAGATASAATPTTSASLEAEPSATATGLAAPTPDQATPAATVVVETVDDPTIPSVAIVLFVLFALIALIALVTGAILVTRATGKR